MNTEYCQVGLTRREGRSNLSSALAQYVNKSLGIETEEANYPRSPKSDTPQKALDKPLGPKDKVPRKEVETYK